jgi:hypothetical protein
LFINRAFQGVRFEVTEKQRKTHDLLKSFFLIVRVVFVNCCSSCVVGMMLCMTIVARMLAIDPSIRECGWAFVGPDRVIESGVIKTRSGSDEEWVQRAALVCEEVMDLRNRFVCRGVGENRCVVELPALWGASDRGAASSNSSAVFKLTTLVGMITGGLICSGWDIRLVSVQRWKGNVPKHITMMRVQRATGWTGKNHNESDAIGLGLWALDSFNELPGS